MRPVSDRFREALGYSHKRVTEVTVTAPGGSPVTLSWTDGSITASSGTGSRYGASLTVSPGPGVFELVATPGAIFTIRHGIDFGGGDKELVPVFSGECASSPSASIFGSDIALSLTDRWKRLERCRFLAPFSPDAGTRASRIQDTVATAIPGQTFVTSSDGGSMQAGKTWDRDRVQYIKDLASDGGLDCAFDAAGDFVIRPTPILTPTTSAWVLRSGVVSNILSADREIPLDRLYNTVVVAPTAEEQTWPRQVVQLADTSHPRHSSKVGVVPYFHSSPTIADEATAYAAGEAILQRVLGTSATLKISALGMPALEIGDTVTVVHEATDTDPGFNAVHIVDSISIDLKNYGMEINTRSSELADLEEAA